MKLIRVMIVEDSQVVRLCLEHIISRDTRFEIVASVGSGEQALAALHRAAPDVISMDIRLPGINGFEATQRIMETRPTPIVVVSASVESEDLQISINALRAGALSVVEKPVGTNHADYELLAERLCTQLAIMSEVEVIRQRSARRSTTDRPALPRSAQTIAPLSWGPCRLVALVASTGGPNALATILSGIPAEFPAPLLLVQHITGAFLSGFISWLGGQSRLSVTAAEDGAMPRPGFLYVAPEDRHLRLRGGRLCLDGGEPVCAQRPSGTVLFQSLAESCGTTALGVLLTGMGEDGAAGIHALRRAGGYTIAEAESTAVVYGMPRAAVGLGAICESLPLPEIGPRIVALAQSAVG